MPKKVTEYELETITNTIANHINGVTLKDLNEELDLDYPKKTLQRRLKVLIDSGRVVKDGSTKGAVYHVHPGEVMPIVMEEPRELYNARKKAEIRLSAEGGEIKAMIERPLTERKAVGYNRSFLEAYIPNQTFYLSAYERQRLRTIGNVGMENAPAGTYVRDILDRLLIDLSWNSSRLEGNTYSLLETENLIKAGLTADGHKMLDAEMILNHKEAIELIADPGSEVKFDAFTVCSLHALLSNNLLSSSMACGLVRSRAVGISGTSFSPLNVPQQIEECFTQMLEKAQLIDDPFERSFFVMVHLPYLQPFEDVNKRTSRLAANIPLVRENLCPLSFIDVDKDDYVKALLGVYELNRTEYLRDVFIWAYERSAQRYTTVRQTLGEPDPFRTKNRERIKSLTRAVVSQALTKAGAVKWLRLELQDSSEQDKMLEVVETELSSLHMGNIARFGLRPSEYEAWMSEWE